MLEVEAEVRAALYAVMYSETGYEFSDAPRLLAALTPVVVRLIETHREAVTADVMFALNDPTALEKAEAQASVQNEARRMAVCRMETAERKVAELSADRDHWFGKAKEAEAEVKRLSARAYTVHRLTTRAETAEAELVHLARQRDAALERAVEMEGRYDGVTADLARMDARAVLAEKRHQDVTVELNDLYRDLARALAMYSPTGSYSQLVDVATKAVGE